MTIHKWYILQKYIYILEALLAYAIVTLNFFKEETIIFNRNVNDRKQRNAVAWN